MKDTKSAWRQQWLTSIFRLTSLSYQQQTWLDHHNTNPHYSFVEFMCCYFDEVLADINYAAYIKMGWVHEMEYDIINHWHEQLDQYDAPDNSDRDVYKILQDTIWLEIVALGKQARFKLIKFVNAEEKKWLMDI